MCLNDTVRTFALHVYDLAGCEQRRLNKAKGIVKMENKNEVNSQFDQVFQQSIQQNMAVNQKGYDVSDERLREMNKRLPAWNLEPPYSPMK